MSISTETRFMWLSALDVLRSSTDAKGSAKGLLADDVTGWEHRRRVAHLETGTQRETQGSVWPERRDIGVYLENSTCSGFFPGILHVPAAP